MDEYYRRTDAAGPRDMLTDALGSVLALADEAGQLKTTYQYEPYGATTVQGEVSSNPFQYTGRENDGTGLYYYRARYYHPGLGRFVAEDPIGLAGGINAYAYVEGNPIPFVDPLGLQVWQPPLRLPPRVEAHNRLNNVDSQFRREFSRDVFPDPSDPLPYIPQVPKPWCRLICPSDKPSCPASQPQGLPKRSTTGEQCREICTTGPFADSGSRGAPPASSSALGPRTAGQGDIMGLVRVLSGR